MGCYIVLSRLGRLICGAAMVLIAVAVQAAAPAEPTSTTAAPGSGRAWTVQDIAAAPEIVDLLISEDGRHAYYILRRGELAKNAKVSRLHRVDLATGADRELAASSWISALRHVPGSSDVSLLANRGEGVQLYRVDGAGRFHAVLVNPELDQVGSATEGPQAFGVSDYGWSPDGSSFWYARRTRVASDARVVNPPFLPLVTIYGNTPIELRVRDAAGADVALDLIDAVAAGYYAVEWAADGSALNYWARSPDHESMEQRRWTRGMAGAQVVSRESAFYYPMTGNAGPRGGELSTRGYGNERTLIETLKDGAVIEHGRVDFRIHDPRASGHWLSPDGRLALFGVRSFQDPRYGLIRLDDAGKMEEVPVQGSLSHCSINRSFTAGACIRQSMTSPPELVRLDPRAGGVTAVIGLAPEYEAIAPLRSEPRTWTNRNGYQASGYVVYPRQYQHGQRYPAVLVTHGRDADQRFVDAEFQWDYPVQAWAERGYVVISMNEPAASNSPELQAAYAQWGGSGTLPTERVQDLIWFNGIQTFEDAVKQLVDEGLVDAQRVGIAGYSAGSQMVNVAMTQSKAFRAASSGDGGYLEPSGYFLNPSSYRAVYGGSPYDPAALSLYQRLSPSFRAAHAAGPILQQVASGRSAQLELHVSLREAGVPSELVYYPDESHLFHVPRNRVAAMQENLDWFDFWLLDKQDPDPAKAAQYRRWRELRTQWNARTK